MSKETKTDKEALKKLREERAEFIEKTKATIKSQNKIIKTIKEQIKEEGKTIPEIAVATDMPSSQVLIYIATLRKYGQIAEGDKDGDYFRYQLVE